MKKVLIANRGEIAVRIVRACADYGVRSVAVYADSDFDALHTRMANEAYSLGGDRPADTYLNIGKLIDAARATGADAVHPGYGFLSENAAFAQAVIDAGLTWIGPPPQVIALLGDKVRARELALRVGAPMAAGTPGPVKDASEVLAFARAHGLPIIIKAAFGGGGRGMKIAWRMEEIEALYDSAVREATAAFGRGECFVEQYLDRPRHIEAQVIANQHGHVVVLGTRDCSLQRRNQKLVEESPAPFLSAAQRERVHAAARAICKQAGYVGAGTVEFLLATGKGADSASDTIAFLEVNTRLQVEHPVTEQTTGIDLVVEQLRIADGLPLSIGETPAPRGHAIELRINAEDAGRGFLPMSGRITRFDAPAGPGVRVDSGVQAGSVVPEHFDSLMAKLIVHGATRAQALARARRALREFHIEGVASVLPFHRAALDHPDFVGAKGFKVHTRWIETDFNHDLAAALRADPPPDATLTRMAIEIDGRRVAIGMPAALLAGLAGWAGSAGPSVSDPPPATPQAPSRDAAAVPAPVSGTLQAWKAREGESVEAGQTIATLEAMKMEMHVTAHRAGRLVCLAQAGDHVQADSPLARIEAE
ncbi:MAG: ATP-grasp domain-containing protein [Burkholderiaceae bacterium]|jgi:acetyl-CoA/propionyl-CoA carboxylase biotin carboxyl carrier protein|nr:ATP-grasp domain-containing protein [Burkholderiaceae bacterium]